MAAEIKLNSKCEQCKKVGITFDGKCVDHYDESIKGMQIGRETVQKVVKDVAEMMIIHLKEANQAYENNDESITINIPVKISLSQEDGIDVETRLTFNTGKITDSRSCTINEKQGKLFDDKVED